MPHDFRSTLDNGIAIPACPLALTSERTFDGESQRRLLRYYSAAGAGGIAIGVHTTQFAIRDAKYGLYEPVLRLAAEEMDRIDEGRETPLVRVGGICGDTRQAVHEAETVGKLGYHAGLLNLGAMKGKPVDAVVQHCRAVAEVIPVFGFYLQPGVGGCLLPYEFWREFAEIENIIAIKIAAFDRYQTIDVIRALAEAGRNDIALYTGNDDNIVMDLLTPWRFNVGHKTVERRFVGGLLGHWAVWTSRSVEILNRCREITANKEPVPQDLMRLANEVTDCNAVIFDAANGFRGCIPAIHEILRRQGLFRTNVCLDPDEVLSPGQAEEIDRLYRAYPHLTDDSFISKWLNG